MYYLTRDLDIVFSEVEIDSIAAGTLTEMESSQAIRQRPWKKAEREDGVRVDVLSDDATERQAEWLANSKQWDNARKYFLHEIRLNKSGYPISHGSLTTFVFMDNGTTIIFHANFNGRIVSESHWSGGTCRKVILVDTTGNSEITSAERIYDMPVYPALYELYLAAQAKRPIKNRMS